MVKKQYTSRTLCNRYLSFVMVLFCIIFTRQGRAQEYLSENFNASSTFPANWNTVNNGNPSSPWTVQAPFTYGGTAITMLGSNFAFCNGDIGGSGSETNATLTSPSFNTSTANLVLLEVDQFYRDYSGTPTDSAIIEVFDGNRWRKIQSLDVNLGTGTAPVKSKLDITAYKNANMRVRFRSVGLWPWYWAFDNVRVFQPSPNDIGVSALIAPSGSCGLSASSPVRIKVRNFGSVAQSAYQINYRIGNNPPVVQTISGVSLGPNTELEHTFSTPANLSAPGDYFISAWTTLAGDGGPSNDSLTNQKITKLGSTISLVNFGTFNGDNLSTIYPGWNEATGTNPTGNTSQWRLSAAEQQTAFGTITAAINLYTTSRREWIVMPSFQANATSGLVFKAALTNWLTAEADEMGSDDSLKVMVSTNCGLTWSRIFSFTAANPPDKNLNEFVIPLTAYAGQEIKLAFVASDGPIDDVQDYDLHLDDIEIRNLLPNNVRASQITSPASGCLVGAPVVKAIIKNIGTQPQGNFPVCLKVNNLPPVCENFTSTLQPNEEAEFVFSNNVSIATPGDYVLSVYTNLSNDQDRLGDTIKNYSFQNLPVISGFPYAESFESSNGGWLPKGTASSWALGTPAKAVIQGAGDGTRAYVTGGLGLGKYNNNEKSWLESPCINFAGISVPVLEMKIWYHSEINRDGANIQASINGGTSWFNIGQVGDILNWYNSSNITGLTGLATNRSGWSGGLGDNFGSGGWITVRNRLTGLGNISNVKIRIIFGADGVNAGDGIGIDAIRIYAQPDNDVSMVAILSPERGGCGATATTNVKVRVRNVGTAAVSNVPVACSVNNGPPVSGNISFSIPPGADTAFVFPVPLDLGANGPFSLSAWTQLSGDGFSGNDTLKNYVVTKKIGLTDTIKFTGFDGINLPVIQSGWAEAFGAVPAGNTSGWRQSTFLQSAKLGSATARVNMQGIVRNDWIISPAFKLQAFPRLRFFLGLTNFNDTISAQMGSDDAFIVKVTEDCGATWVTLRTITRDSLLNNRMREKSVDLTAYEGKIIRIAFHVTSGPVADPQNYDLHLDNIFIKSVSPADAGVSAVLSPSLSCGLSANTPVSVVLRNFGTNPVSNFPVRFRVGSGAVVSQNFNGVLAAGETATFNFTQGANMAAAGIYTLRVWTGLEGDILALNDSSRISVAKSIVPTSPVNLIPYIGNNLPAVNTGWLEATGNNALAENSKWTGGTHLNQACLKVAMRGAQINEWVLSPGTLLNQNSAFAFEAACLFPGTNTAGVLDVDDSIAVQVSANCGQTWKTIFKIQKNMANVPDEAFTSYLVPLTDYANQEVRIALRAFDGIRIDDTSDVFITNVRFDDLTALNQTRAGASSWTIAPNPARDQTNILLPSAVLKPEIRICSMDGRLMEGWATTGAPDSGLRLDISSLPSGVYSVSVFDSERNIFLGIRKLIKN